MADQDDGSTASITDWRSIVTLIVFVLTNLVVLFPFHVPLYIPRPLANGALDCFSALRIISPRQVRSPNDDDDQNGKVKPFARLNIPLNFVTAPLIADLFLLAILAIGRDEVYGGTVGSENISPLDIMAFFFTLAYIAISIDASGLIRYLAFKVIQKGGKVGHRLFFYLYAFFFGLGSFIGNDPIILSGTAFLAYMTRVSSNIIHPRAWIHTQFAIANIASAILVSSNPTNLVLAGAFQVKFVEYTANMIVPVIVTAIVLFPFLLYIVFADEALIPLSIKMHELSAEERAKKPVNPNIPNARGVIEEEERMRADSEEGKLLSLEEIMNPFVDRGGAAFGALIMATTLVTILVLNAVSQTTEERPVFWVTAPAAFVMLCWDLAFGWLHRHETREISRRGRQEVEDARAEKLIREQDARRAASLMTDPNAMPSADVGLSSEESAASKDAAAQDGHDSRGQPSPVSAKQHSESNDDTSPAPTPQLQSSISVLVSNDGLNQGEHSAGTANQLDEKRESTLVDSSSQSKGVFGATPSDDVDEEKRASSERFSREAARQKQRERLTLVSVSLNAYRWAQETFPTVTAVLSHLPYALVPFALSMFVLVQALVTKGWVQVFAYGWDHWVNKTGIVGSIGGMGFVSVILCNFAGTNIGTTILLCRVIQSWTELHSGSTSPISDRTFWGTVYGMALGVNYGAFSTAFSASLAGLLWRDILGRKHIHVRRLEFARVNVPIIAIAMAVGCSVLVGEVYIMRTDEPFSTG